MPKVKPLTEKQAIELEDKAISDAILKVVKERKGLYDLLEEEVADRLNISTSSWAKIKRNGFGETRFKTVLAAVRLAGYELKLEKRKEPKRRPKAVPISKDDTHGTIIEGFIKRIVIETMEEYGL